MKNSPPIKQHPVRAKGAAAGIPEAPEANYFGIFIACLIIAVLVFLSNWIWPKNYELLAWGYLSFYPLWMQYLWGIGVVGALLGAYWVVSRPAITPRWPIGLAAAAILLTGLALLFWRTPYPGLVGDGESLRIGGTHDPRWPIVIAHTLAALCLQGDAVTAWWILETGYGFLYIGLAARIAWSFRAQPWTAVGLLFWMLGTPVLMNACGHFDSLASILVTGTVWWITLWKLDQASGWTGLIRWGLVLLGVAVLAVLSSPVNMALLGLTVAVMGLRAVRLLQGERFLRWAIPVSVPVMTLGLVVGMAIYGGPESWFIRPAQRGGVDMPLLRGEYLWYYLRSTVWLFLNVALPAAILGIWALIRRRRTVGKPLDEIQAVALAGFLAVWWFPVATMQGINDETAFAPIGLLALGSAGLMFLRGGVARDQAGILFVGILALALQVPRLALYTSSRFVERYEKLYPHDRCAFNNQMSPFVHLGLMLHPYDAYCREARLRVFREGTNTLLPAWNQFRMSNLMYYTAWCYEYGHFDEGREALRIMLRAAPANIPYLASPGTMFTHRHKNRAFRVIRHDVQGLLDTEFNNPKSGAIYGQLRQFLAQMDNQPAPHIPPSFWSGDSLKPQPTDGPFMTWYKKTVQAHEQEVHQWYFQRVEGR